MHLLKKRRPSLWSSVASWMRMEVTPSQAYESISSKADSRGLLHRMDALGLSFPPLGQIG